MISIINLILFMNLLCYTIILASYTNFEIKSFRLCNDTQGLFKFHGNITKEGDNYYTTSDITFPIPIDEKIGGTWKIESLVLNKYVELFTIREKDLCKAANMYGGEFYYDILRGAQVLPKTCPIQPGRYALHHVKLDFNKISLQTFPFGYLRFTGKAVDNKHPHNKLLCGVIEVNNVPN